MNCSICGKPIILVPSASERAKQYGKTASYYTSLFTSHSACQIKKNKEEVSKLIKRKKELDSTVKMCHSSVNN